MRPRNWLITGASRGLGRVWTEAALARGDRVTAVARDPAGMAEFAERYGERFTAVALDITDEPAVRAAVSAARERFGTLDIAVNNAGYCQFGAIEEVSPDEARRQLDVNLFGALWMTRAAVAIMREQRAGHILQVTSIGGVHAYPTMGLYHASKFALEGLSQSLAAEVARFGVRVTIVEPDAFATGFRAAASYAAPIADYDPVRTDLAAAFAQVPNRAGDPAATADAILAIVDSADPPQRIMLGANALNIVREEYATRLATWERWGEVARRAHGTPTPDTSDASVPNSTHQ